MNAIGRLLLPCLMVAATPGALAATPDLSSGSMATFFDAAFATQIQDHEIVGVVVSVVHDGEVIFKKGYGWADLEERLPADPDRSLFRIASISKPFIWTAVMQLVEQGRLDLDDDVNDYLVDFKIPNTYPEPIRIRHLLTHTPGLEDRAIGMNARSLETRQPLATYLEEQLPARVRPPGIHAAYSNWGTSLAAHVVERITGQRWSAYVDEHILLPLGMHSTNTRTVLSPDFEARMAKSYVFSSGRFIPRPYEYLNDEPAGLISTTADDMTRFMLAHLNLGEFQGRRILREDTARRMQSPLFDPHPGISPMLHGFYRSDRNGQKIFGHGGDTNQFHSNLSLFPEHGLGVFISTNSDSAAAARSNLIRAFVDHFFPDEYLRPAPASADVDLDEYAGEYIPLRSSKSTIERLGILVAGLNVVAAEQALILNGGSRWIALGDDRFTGRYVDRLMVFERDDDQVSHMIIGEPLASYRKVSGLDAPGNIRNFMIMMAVIALVAVLGYGWRAFKRAPESRRLPARNVIIAWVHALLILGLYAYLARTLSGDVEDFVFGVPTDAHVNIWLLVINTLIGMVVIIAGVSHWVAAAGTVGARIRYSAIGLAALMNAWVAWYFNLLTYPFA